MHWYHYDAYFFDSRVGPDAPCPCGSGKKSRSAVGDDGLSPVSYPHRDRRRGAPSIACGRSAEFRPRKKGPGVVADCFRPSRAGTLISTHPQRNTPSGCPSLSTHTPDVRGRCLSCSRCRQCRGPLPCGSSILRDGRCRTTSPQTRARVSNIHPRRSRRQRGSCHSRTCCPHNRCTDIHGRRRFGRWGIPCLACTRRRCKRRRGRWWHVRPHQE